MAAVPSGANQMESGESSLPRNQKEVVPLARKTVRKRVLFPSGAVRGGTEWTNYDMGRVTGGGTHSAFLSNYPFLNGIQVTESENHPEWRKRHSLPYSDIGGDFFTQKRYVEGVISRQTNPYVKVVDSDTYTEAVYNGPCVASVPAASGGPTGFLPFSVSSDTALRAAGTTAIARCKPTNSTADLAVALGELYRERLPDLIGSSTWKDRTLKAKNAGSDYLAIQFGFKPLANEIASFANGVVSSGDLLDQYITDAGKVVRRGYKFSPTTSQSTTIMSTNTRPAVGGATSDMSSGIAATGRVLRLDSTVVRRWFSGAFTYELPSWFDNSNPLDRERLLAQKILGLELTPTSLWNLAPWTWAVDWFTNTGDVISNLTDWAVDGLSLRYGYIMEHSLSRRTYVFEGPTGYRGSLIPQPLTLVTETKVRKRATPFGFGTTWDTLSQGQLAILAALGISRGK